MKSIFPNKKNNRSILSDRNGYLSLLCSTRSIIRMADFYSSVNALQCSKTSCRSGVNSAISPSAKNSERVIPNPLQIRSNVVMEGIEFLRKILVKVGCGKPQFLANLYSLQPRSSSSCQIL